jgi:hypothetical protein
MLNEWRKWLLVGSVLLAAHFGTAAYYAHRYASGVVRTPSRAMTLDLTFDEWAQGAAGADSTVYLEVARNVAAGRGVVWQTPGTDPPQTEPFDFWGPGAPAVFGGWLKLVGGQTMFTFFAFAVAAQLFFGVMAVATAALYTRNTCALALTAFCTGFCPPLQEWYYGVHLTSSEIAALPALGLLFFALSKAFLAYRGAPAGWQFRQIPVRVWLWFGMAGLLIGLYSLTRDPGRVLAWFLALFVIGRAAALDRRRLATAAAAGLLLVAGTYLVRYPVQIWNKARSGRSTICQASDGSIWRYGLWMKHDQYDWYDSCGIGFGEYLDPDSASRVEQRFASGAPRPALYSLGQLVQAIARRPADALAFKAARLPVLFLATDRWPRSRLRLESVWCIAFYAMLFAAIGWRLWRRLPIPEPLYVYLLFILCASVFIHFEFRYTFTAWNTLVLVPGLLVSMLAGEERSPARGVKLCRHSPRDFTDGTRCVPATLVPPVAHEAA